MDKIVKRRIRIICLVVIVAGTSIWMGTWLVYHLKSKPEYDDLREKVSRHSFTKVKMDDKTKTLLVNAQSKWTRRELEDVVTTAIETLELSPSISNLVFVFCYQMPEYSFWSSDQNMKAFALGMAKAMIFPYETVDGLIHVSEGGRVAVIRLSDNSINVYTDESDGVRETLFLEATEGIEQEAEGDGTTRTP